MLQVLKWCSDLVKKLDQRKKERLEEKNWKEFLADDINRNITSFHSYDIKVLKINQNIIKIKYRDYIPVGVSWSKTDIKISKLDKDTQKKINYYIRRKKLEKIK